MGYATHVCGREPLRSYRCESGDEPTKKVGESWRRACKLPGFSGYFLIDTGEGVISSIGLFDTSTQANESARVASEWVRDENLEKILKNPPEPVRW